MFLWRYFDLKSIKSLDPPLKSKVLVGKLTKSDRHLASGDLCQIPTFLSLTNIHSVEFSTPGNGVTLRMSLMHHTRFD